MRAIQASSITFEWPDGRKELLDFDASLDKRVKDFDAPVGSLKTVLLNDAEDQIRYALEHYRPEGFERFLLARDLEREYVIVGKESNGFIGIRAFAVRVADPRLLTFTVNDLDVKLHKGEVADFSEGEIHITRSHGRLAIQTALLARLDARNEEARSKGNISFAPPFLLMDITHSTRSYLSDPGPCASKDTRP
jgi:hypothetical protein